MDKNAIQDALLSLGEKRMQAAILSVLMDQSPVTTQEIMEATGLRQPEVSIGVRELKQRGWLEATPIPREGKGRPMNQYSRRFQRGEFLAHYKSRAEAIRQKALEAESTLQDLDIL